MSHSFEEKTYTHLTYCDACKQLLWGVRKQGFQCKECGYNCHRRCQASASKCSHAITQGFLDDADHKSNSRAEDYLRQLSQKSTGTDRRSPTASGASTTVPKHAQAASTSVYQSAFQHVKAIATSEKLQNILAEAATTQQMPVNAYLAQQAPLNPQITARNFTRFVSRCGPVFAFRDEVLLLLSWENRIDTLVSLIIYCVVCLHPKMVFLAPQTMLIYFILSSYPKKRASGSMNLKDKAKQKVADKQAAEDKANKHTQHDTPNKFPFNLSTLFQPASDESPEYLRNLQNIQNTMGEFSDMYDWIMSQTNQLNWSSEEKTMRILQLIIISSILVSVALFIIPIKLIFLSFGLLVYGLNTRFAKYVIAEIKPYMIQFGKKQSMDLVKCDDSWRITIPQIEPVDFDDGEQKNETMTRRRRWVRECEKLQKTSAV
ncbi:hypothetical protein [Parasitella parasitica]|uniref:Phorbol-ester/DAG-type domain-containing protein n=1 Tax=Parasitella parasitica TaxID=35722 RepID=A0A0B7N4M7_9FUNG|nr:hypothetical protein [Parasitella parasitica]